MFKTINAVIKEVLFGGKQVPVHLCPKCEQRRKMLGRKGFDFMFVCTNNECEEKAEIYHVNGPHQFKKDILLIETSVEEGILKIIGESTEGIKVIEL